MNTLSKAQVIALLLATASADDSAADPAADPAAPASCPVLTAMSLLNGPTNVDNVPTDQVLLDASSGTACAANSECTEAGEKCGAFQVDGAAETTSYCVHEEMCGFLGKLEGTAWSLQCWDTPADGATPVAPTAVDPAAYLTALEGMITKQTVSWANEKNLIVSSKFNWQDGWFTINDQCQFVEVDKAADNRCFLDVQCDPDECCANYPDTNNRRCMKTTAHNIEQTAGPVSFTPTCPNLSSDGDDTEEVVPENAQDDIAKGALSDASEALNSFWDSQVADKKAAAEYDKMDEEAKTAFDAVLAVEKTQNDATSDSLKTAMGYATDACDDTCKAVFEGDLLKWKKAVYELCKENDKQITCTKADELRTQQDEARAAATDGNYYSAMTVEQREAFDKGYAEEQAKNEATLTAAWVKDNAPAEGESGFACVEDKCEVGSESYWCCGTSNRVGNVEGNTTGQLTKVCARDANGDDERYTGAWEDSLGVKYQHTCELAQKLVATAAATVAAAYALM